MTLKRKTAGLPETPTEPDALPPATAPPAGPRRIRIRAAESMAGALRRLLARQLLRLKQLKSAAFAADEEAIHDMRVAIRRARAGLRMAQPYVRRQTPRPFRRGLRDAAQALGGVRDMDVILAHVEGYRDRNPEHREGLAAWVSDLTVRREESRQSLQDYLTGKQFSRTLKAFRDFLADVGRPPQEDGGDSSGDPFSSLPGSPRVRDILPASVWAQYGSVRAYEVLEAPPLQTLHALRIEIKRLRYLLEFFESVLTLRIRPAIELLIRAQDHLGRLHDASVAIQMLRTYVAANALATARDFSAAAAYLAELETEIGELTRTFPPLHAEIAGPLFRRRLARLLSRF